MSDDLIKRLRSFDGYPRARQTVMEAADRIEALQAENALLREALDKIAC